MDHSFYPASYLFGKMVSESINSTLSTSKRDNAKNKDLIETF